MPGPAFSNLIGLNKMNRRNFLASMSAAFASSVLGGPVLLGSHQRIQWDLFCCPFFGRYDIANPFQVGPRIVGTDSRLLVSIPSTAAPADGERVLPDLGRLAWSEFDRGHWSELQPFGAGGIDRSEDTGDCPECFGRGRVGPGVVPCFCDNHETYMVDGDAIEWRCGECIGNSWKGGSACSVCSGTGTCQTSSFEIISGTVFDGASVNRIRTLGPVDIRIVPGRDARGESANVLLARFGNGGQAMHMSMGPMPRRTAAWE